MQSDQHSAFHGIENPEQPALLLTGIEGSNPLGFLAALGALLAVEQCRMNREEPRLCWRNEGLWHPVIFGVDSFESLAEILLEDVRSFRDDPALNLRYEKASGKPAHDLKPPPERFRAYLDGLLRRLDEGDVYAARALDYAAAFGTETAVDNNGNVKPTALHFTAGQQEFLAMVQELVEKVTAEDLIEAVRGPWSYTRPLPVLQWDATATRFYALRASDPSTDKKLGVPGADWLAFRGLAFLRVAPAGDRIVTTGCGGGWKSGHFTWPLWSVPATVDSIRSLIGTPDLIEMTAFQRAARGIGIVFRSDIHRTDQGGYGSFTPARVS